jgi:3-oxoadipate enol-lactonase
MRTAPAAAPPGAVAAPDKRGNSTPMPTLRLETVELYYEALGQGPPLLFIHGLGASTDTWTFQKDVFASEYRVIAVDLRGHGRSSKPPGPYSIRQMAEDAAALLAALACGPACVVGHSLGGAVAVELALRSPDQVRALVLVNSAPAIPRGTLLESLKLALAWRMREWIVRLRGMHALGAVLSRRLFPRPGQAELRRAMVEQWAANDKRAYLAALKALWRWPGVADRLATLHCPALVIAAEHDYTPVSFKQAYVARMPRTEIVVIPDSRHMTPLDQPAAFNAALGAFLRRDAAAARPADPAP